jgi:hypothetical protein
MRKLAVFVFTLGSLFGCGAVLERAGVSRDFTAQFGCQAAKITRVGSGFRVQGCDRVASYACVDTHRELEDRSLEPGRGRLAGALLGALVEDSMRPDQCFLAYTERLHESPRLVSGQAAFVQRRQTTASPPQLATRTPFAGGSLALTAKPALHPGHVLLSVRSTRRLTPPPCSAELFHDGVPVHIEAMQRAGSFEARILLQVESLRDVHRAARFAGRVCGLEFELDEAGLKTVGLFEARFREERAHIEAQLAASRGGEQVAE